ncbi:2-succinyl-5-enolpyruvyl-6-hydroxy-3-cyclohexene-1-carboxylic-acid synthase [Mycolicibacterium sp. XJ870]
MNPSTIQSRVIVDELARNGVRHVVLCPGSRNAPLSFALYDAVQTGKVSLHVRVDERSAGFLALGLSRGLALGGRSREIAAVVCTSGTAVANLHPAVLEAHHSGTPMLVITADRPPEYHGTGASQTIDQHAIYGNAAAAVEFPVAERRCGQNALWRGLVCRAVGLARAGTAVQLNMPFREPLVPDGDEDWPESTSGRIGGTPWTRTSESTDEIHGGSPDQLTPRTLMIIGETRPDAALAASRTAWQLGWPVLAEPTSAGYATLDSDNAVVNNGALIAQLDELPSWLLPDSVVVVGRSTLSRGVQRIAAQAPVLHVVGDPVHRTDLRHSAHQVSVSLVPEGPHRCAWQRLAQRCDPSWLRAWLDADAAAAKVVDDVLSSQPWPSGLQLARNLVDALPARSLLFVGASNPIRDVNLVAVPRSDIHVVSNRGVAGIDGSISTAVGAALGLADGAPDGRTAYALMGDLTFLHDITGLAMGPAEPRPDLTIVVLNDSGGGIFSLLEQGEPQYAEQFERIFGTPQSVDIARLCAGFGVPHQRVDTADEFRAAITPRPGVRVVEVGCPRSILRPLHTRLRAAIAAAVANTVPRQQ